MNNGTQELKPCDGNWPKNDLRRAFVDGAKWCEHYLHGATIWPNDRHLAEIEAEKKYADRRPIEDELRAKYEKAKAARDSWHESAKSVDVKLEQAEAEIEQEKEVVDAYSDEIDTLKETNRQLRVEIERLKEETVWYEGALRDKEDEIERLKRGQRETNDKLKEAYTDLAAANKRIEQARVLIQVRKPYSEILATLDSDKIEDDIEQARRKV